MLLKFRHNVCSATFMQNMLKEWVWGQRGSYYPQHITLFILFSACLIVHIVHVSISWSCLDESFEEPICRSLDLLGCRLKTRMSCMFLEPSPHQQSKWGPQAGWDAGNKRSRSVWTFRAPPVWLSCPVIQVTQGVGNLASKSQLFTRILLVSNLAFLMTFINFSL